MPVDAIAAQNHGPSRITPAHPIDKYLNKANLLADTPLRSVVASR
jgi:hypothetical protein